MNRTQWLWIGVIAVELAVGGYFVAGRLNRPTPPVPDFSNADPIAAEEIRALAGKCRTAKQWARLGEVYLVTGFFPEGEACYREASALDSADADLAMKHAFALERLGKLEEANARYQIAIERNHPRTADCWYYIGRNHLRLDQSDPAADAFQRAGSLPAARFELAKRDARAGRLAEAEAEARRLADQFPTAYPVTSLRYRLAVARDDGASADTLADQFPRQRANLPSPFDAEVKWVFEAANGVGRDRLFRDAGREVQAGRVPDAEKKLRDALAPRWSPDVADKLADVVFVLGRPGEAVDVLSRVVTEGGPSSHRLWRLGQAYDEAGQRGKTLEVWERAARLATGPGNRDLWHDLAERYERAGQQDRAKTFYAREQLAAGMATLDAGRTGDAAQALTRAVGQDPGLAHAWYHLGEAHRATHRPDDARAAYEKCLLIDPNHGRARRSLKLLKDAP